MSQEPHVVTSTPPMGLPQIEGVFSNEGLAQTYAAKLREDPKNLIYAVAPLVMDELVTHERTYWGYCAVSLTDPILREDSIQVRLGNLQVELPANEVVRAEFGEARPDLTFYAYAWDRISAREQVLKLATDYLTELNIVWTYIPVQGELT